MLLLLACAAHLVAAGSSWLGGGGAQAKAEALKAHSLEHGEPAHPLHADRKTVRHGEVGVSGPFVVGGNGTEPFSHFFETSVGSGHMSLTLREDWRQHLRMAARDLGVKHIRGHGLLDDDMSVSYAYGKHAFYNIDSLVDVLLSVGMRPIFELSFMPDWLTSGNHTICHYKGNTDPPTDYSMWGELIGALGSHMVSKYGEAVASEFLFEVWNEPNDNFWKGGQEGYWELYTHAARALKAASPTLQVGGPATCCADCWIADFVKHMDTNKVPYDFISTHAYSSCGMAGLGDVDEVVKKIHAGRAILTNVTSSDHSNHPQGKSPPWIITEFGDNCGQGFGNGGQFPSGIHDMIDQSSYTFATMDQLAGPGEPQALSYWAVSDVFEESYFPIHNESFHGMFGLINLHGVPKPTYRAYQLLHEAGDLRLRVTGPTKPKPPRPVGTCSSPAVGEDVYGGDVAAPVVPCPTCGLFTLADCCKLCLEQTDPPCDVADLWHQPGSQVGYRCGLKSFAKRTNVSANPGRTYLNVSRAPTPPFTNDQLCALNTGVLAVQKTSAATAADGDASGDETYIDLFVYNHASFADPIVECNVTVVLPSSLLGYILANATVRRIDETHANPLAAWIKMGAPDYTTAPQNKALVEASELVLEKLSDIASVNVEARSFTMTIPTHGVAAVRVTK
jgi:xylan 1,4-beta-xylosidase